MGSTPGAVPHHSQGSCLGTGHSVDTENPQCWVGTFGMKPQVSITRGTAASFPSPSFLLVIQTLDNLTTGTQVLDLKPQMCVLDIV